MSDIVLGKLVDGKQERDAIHIAIIPMRAAEKLIPGQRIGVVSPGVAGTKSAGASNITGIVDPFLDCIVSRGSQFWMCLFQNTVTGMRHHWKHPAFDSAPTEWMQRWADIHLGGDLERAIDIGETMYVGADEGLGECIDDEWWDNWEAITGKKSDNRGGYFGCAC